MRIRIIKWPVRIKYKMILVKSSLFLLIFSLLMINHSSLKLSKFKFCKKKIIPKKVMIIIIRYAQRKEIIGFRLPRLGQAKTGLKYSWPWYKYKSVDHKIAIALASRLRSTEKCGQNYSRIPTNFVIKYHLRRTLDRV